MVVELVVVVVSVAVVVMISVGVSMFVCVVFYGAWLAFSVFPSFAFSFLFSFRTFGPALRP